MDPANQGEADQELGKLSQVIQIDEGKIQAHLGEVLRSIVEETLNAMWMQKRTGSAVRNATNEARPARIPGQVPTSGSCTTKVGPASLKVPKLRSLPFEKGIIERYKRRESSVEEALVECILPG